ncbi:Vitellinogen, open beta-sheet,von Willebrand factor, type D domain,Lipid transport protein, N- [Cinara cedri]|uniref:Vitellinogen, open beta-sheet,von Willebrand factor, type D domain,Lipid transport protein, N n=1 Tax=Cinara cedri TaxID=506608 RepID=A0A5E4MG15_9HEMI|nr:Vitellinogen, open beta-sheet,von Willebrand factor, type D domain,Lipid transport protein, N- [Cinara cedri]
MGTLIQLALLTLAVGLASSKLAIITDDDGSEQCSTECTDGIANGDVVFTENYKYSYVFDGNTVITAPTGTPEGQSEISIIGIANIIGTQKCGGILYLKHVEITQGSKTYNNTKLEGYPIRFSFNNGKVGMKLCSSSKDSVASMNLKRAILSTLQVSSVQESPKDLFETDVQGTCNTSYSSISSGTINKKKDLTQCTGHDKINLFGLTPSQTNLVYADSPFSIAIQKSDIQIVSSTILSVKNKETLLYQPFGPIDVITKITASMNLALKKKGPTNPPPVLNLKKARSIVFEKPSSSVEPANSDDLVVALQSVMQNLEPVVEMDGAKSYADLISLLKTAKKKDILDAFDQINNDLFYNPEMAQKVFIDALMATNSGESIDAVAKLIDSHILSDSLTAKWFNNLANAKCPTKEAVASASNLLNQRGLKDAYIGVGSLIRNYIKETQDTKSPEIEKALNNLGAPLKKANDVSLSPNDEDLVIASLKGIGNAQYINSDVADQIVQIIMNKSVKPRIKAAALNVAKMYADNPQIEKACENVFTDTSVDSELRLLAFKAFATYPSNNKANVIKKVLDDKNCQLQIQAYLISYLRNLQTTVDENKLDQKKFYGGIQSMSQKKSLGDILRYSQNLEYSYQSPLLHSGVLVNGDVLYSYDSFLARSSSVSTKALVFGRQHHVFDIDTRVENIEPLLEKLFGPEGYVATHKSSTLDDIKNYINQAVDYAKHKQQNNVDSTMSAEESCENVSKEDLKNIYMDVALKVFGNDIGWFSFQGHECQLSYQHIIDAILQNFDNSLPDKKKIEVNIRKQIQIVDYENKYATCSGLPVTLNIQATSAIKINLATNIDLKSYFEQPENSNFALKFIPSGSLTLNTLLTVDGHTVEVGNKVSSSLHTSTGLDYALETIKGHGFEMIYELPLDVMDVLSAKSGAFSIIQEKGSPTIETPLMSPGVERQTYTKTFDSLKNTLGLSFSAQYDIPWDGNLHSLLPFSGPLSFSFKVLKEDENLTKYVVKGTYDFKSQSVKYIKFMYVTPGADISRGVEFVLAYETRENDQFIIELKTPSSEIILQSIFINLDLKKIIEIKYVNGSEHLIKFGLEGEVVDKDTTRYIPIYEALYAKQINAEKEKNPYLSNIEIEGNIIVQRNIDSESVSMKSVAKRSVDYQSGNSNNPTKLLYDVAAVTNKGTHSLKGSLTIQNNDIEAHSCLTTDRVTLTYYGYLSGEYPIFKLISTLNMIKHKHGLEELPSDNSDVYQPESELIKLLYRIQTLNIATNQLLRVESPYIFKSTNRIVWDDKDYFEINGDILIENDEFTMLGNISTTDLLDLVLNANITILPSTSDHGEFIFGQLEHSFISDPSSKGSGDFKYVQDKDKKGSYFEFISRCPHYTGVFDFITQHHYTDEGFQYELYYDLHDGTLLQVNMNTLTNDIQFDANFNSPNTEYKSSINFHGWSNKENTYLFDTKLVWPCSHESNYLNANGKLFLNGLQSDGSGNVDFPSANLDNVKVSFKSIPNPEIEDGGIAIVRCFSNDQVYFSEKFKYKLTLNDGQLHVSGESIPEDSQNILPVKFDLNYKNYTDPESNIGKQLVYDVELEYNGHRYKYKRSMQITKHMFIYRQLYQIDDQEQKIEMDLEYDGTDAWNWSYNLKSKVISPGCFHYLLHDTQNALDFNSKFKLTNNLCDQAHNLTIYSSDHIDDSYELKAFVNNNKRAIKIRFGDREIRDLAYYSIEPIEGGHKLTYKGQLWLDYIRNKNAESALNLISYYSLEKGLSTVTDLNLLIPSFNNKTMAIKNDIEMFKSWENPLDVKLDLDIFPTTEQTLHLHSSLKRSLENNGVLYSAELKAISDGMDLDYLVKDSILVSNEKWGKYLDISFVDSQNIERPVQLHAELTPDGFINKINIFDITVINVDSRINVKDGVLNTCSNIDYNNHPYTFSLSLTPKPSFNFVFGWNDKEGSPEKLDIEGSITMDDAAVINANHVINNNEVMPIGTVKKSLQQSNWWNTDNQMSSEQWNLIWQSVKGQIITQIININNNLQNIKAVASEQRNIRIREAKRAKLQTKKLKKFTLNEWSEIWDEVWADEYILKFPILILNTTEIVFAGEIEIVKNIEPVDVSFSNLYGDVNVYPKKVYEYYARNIEYLLDQLALGLDALGHDGNLALIDLYNILDTYTNKPMNDMQSSDPHSIKEYLDYVMINLINTIAELKGSIDSLHDVSADYISKNLPSNDMFHDQIEKLKSYPYKEKLWEEIHNYLKELEATAPTKEYQRFINALDEYINKVIHDVPVDETDITNLRNKGIIMAKSLIFDFSDYVDYEKAMSICDALGKLTNLGKNVLYVVSPGSFSHQNDVPNIWRDLSQYAQIYHNYLEPSNLLPPFRGQGVIMDSTNIITYNGKYYSFTPNTGTYILAKDNMNDKFSILANYNDNVLTSISVLNDHGETYVLQPGGSATVNGKGVNFPFINDNVKMWEDIYFYGIDASVGLNIKCSMEFDMIEVFINGYYYGNVFGLLGTMYQEPTFDLKLPNGQISDDMQTFLKAYKVSGNTEPTVNDLVSTDQPPCPSIFSGVSSLKSCFPIMSPAAYRSACNQMVSAKSQQDGVNKACLVAKTYVSMARENFATDCSIPDVCVTSTVNDRSIGSSSSVEFSEKSDAADIMILFEEATENQNVFLIVLKPFMENIIKNFNDKGINDINFIIIGYSEQSEHSGVHIYSANKGNNYEGILDNMPQWSEMNAEKDTGFSSQFVDSYKKLIGKNSKDKAYKLSGEYPFRPNAVKAVLAVTQTVYTTDSTLDVSQYTFDLITSCFVEQGIKFHLVAPINLQDSSNPEIFGTNGADTVYTLTKPKGTNSNEYTYDKSLETGLVVKTNGIMFDSHKFVTEQDDEKIIYLKALSKIIAKRAIKDSHVTKSCTTVVHDGIMPYTRCSIVPSSSEPSN